MSENNTETMSVEKSASRREFLGRTLAAGAVAAVGTVLPAEAQAPVCASPAVGETLLEIPAITKTGGSVKGTIAVLNEQKAYLGKSVASGSNVCQQGQMRYFTGSMPGKPNLWVPKKGTTAPGPTIRARVGDTVEITLLNQVDVKAFGNSLDAGDGSNACDVATSVGPGGSVNTYPGNPPYDVMPDCFHGSSTANLHYHGTHVSPNILGDNVFVQLRPSPRVGANPVVNQDFLDKNDFGRIFTNSQAGHSPQKWGDLPLKWQAAQRRLLVEYDQNAVWQGRKGATPEMDRLWNKDEMDIHAGRWPQYYVGAYPSYFKLPAADKDHSMGQSPGTHWYHAHKHGSTALNLSNGLAGAFIIEGEYDDKLKPFFNREVVLVVQQYATQVNLLKAPGTETGDLVYVNGQFTPKITMKKNEVQMWRIVNACHQSSVALVGPKGADGLKWIQTAQDGVQLHPDNYGLALKAAGQSGWTNAGISNALSAAPWFGSLAPGNRIDLLVQAPATAGTYPVTFGGGTLLLTVEVENSNIGAPVTFPPPQAAFPQMPKFLSDLNPDDVVVRRDLHFRTAPKQGRNGAIPPDQTINKKKFEDHIIDQTMQLGATEEWTLYNDGGPAHPFHIHINPFQLTEIKLPGKDAVKTPSPWVWWDVVAIPPGGYIKFLSKFADFTGAYVLHCHILGHEDRGMMEMVQVISNTTTLGHH